VTIDARLRRLEAAAGEPVCPECGAGSGKVTLLPIVYDDEGRQVIQHHDPEPCPRCGLVPMVVTLGLMKLDGDVDLDERRDGTAEVGLAGHELTSLLVREAVDFAV
jgi:hypothetical protein